MESLDCFQIKGVNISGYIGMGRNVPTHGSTSGGLFEGVDWRCFFLESLFFCFSTFFESFFLDLDMDFFLDIQSMLLLGGFWVESR